MENVLSGKGEKNKSNKKLNYESEIVWNLQVWFKLPDFYYGAVKIRSLNIL